MMDLMDFKGDEQEPADRVEALRKHSMVFEATGAHSQALPLYEVCFTPKCLPRPLLASCK